MNVRTYYYTCPYSHTYYFMVRYKKPKPGRAAVREGKVRKEFWLDPKTLAEAQRILGVETEREAVAQALDLVVFSEGVGRGIRALSKMHIEPLEE